MDNVLESWKRPNKLLIKNLNKNFYVSNEIPNNGDVYIISVGTPVNTNSNGEKFIDATDALWVDSENIGEDDNNIVFLDYDSDGDPDFLISSLTGEDRLLVNDGKGKFNLLQPVLKGNILNCFGPDDDNLFGILNVGGHHNWFDIYLFRHKSDFHDDDEV